MNENNSKITSKEDNSYTAEGIDLPPAVLTSHVGSV